MGTSGLSDAPSSKRAPEFNREAGRRAGRARTHFLFAGPNKKYLLREQAVETSTLAETLSDASPKIASREIVGKN
jgi:hypothetical protein